MEEEAEGEGEGEATKVDLEAMRCAEGDGCVGTVGVAWDAAGTEACSHGLTCERSCSANAGATVPFKAAGAKAGENAEAEEAECIAADDEVRRSIME